jgi:hypothetical protein
MIISEQKRSFKGFEVDPETENYLTKRWIKVIILTIGLSVKVILLKGKRLLLKLISTKHETALTGYKVCIIEIEDKFDVSDVKDK